MSATPCNQNAEESFPVLSLKSREQEPPNPLLIRDKAFYRLVSGCIGRGLALSCISQRTANVTDPLPEREPMSVLASQDLAGDHGDQDMQNHSRSSGESQ